MWTKPLCHAKSQKDRELWVTDPTQTLQLLIFDTPSNSFGIDSSQKTDDANYKNKKGPKNEIWNLKYEQNPSAKQKAKKNYESLSLP